MFEKPSNYLYFSEKHDPHAVTSLFFLEVPPFFRHVLTVYGFFSSSESKDYEKLTKIKWS